MESGFRLFTFIQLVCETRKNCTLDNFGMIMDGRAQPTGVRQRGTEATMLLILNGHFDMVEFTLPTAPGGSIWTWLIDTNVPHDNETPSSRRGMFTG